MNMLAVTLAVLQVCAVQQEAKLVPAQAQPTAYFGWSVDLGPGRVVVGSPGHQPPSGGLQGAVYVFEKFGSSWVQQAILGSQFAPLPQGADFGAAVALDGDRIAVGAPHAYNGSSAQVGQVFVFVKQGLTWIEEVVIDNATLKSIRPVGSRVALEGDTLLIGSPAPHSGYANNTPATVYVYHRGPTGWIQQAKLQPQDGVEADYFGWSMALQGDTAFIGSPGYPGGLPSGVSYLIPGAVYVYQRTGTTWALRQVLRASDGQLGEMFGGSISVSGNTLLISAPRVNDPQIPAVGGAYVYTWNGSEWVEQEKIVPHGRTPFGLAGWKTSMNGSMFVMNGPASWEQSVAGGAFYLYSRVAKQWTEHLKISPADGKSNDGFSSSISVHGNTIAVGAPSHAALAPLSGAVYIFAVVPNALQTSYYCKPKPSGKCMPRILHWGQPSVSGATAGEKYELWGWEVAFNQWGMLVYSVSGPGGTPFKGGTLCLAPPIVRTKLQPSTAPNIFEPCNSMYRYDFNERIKSGVDPALTAGQQVWFQYWSRDKNFAPPDNVGLTDAVTAVICQ
jgi:hypothetical protein